MAKATLFILSAEDRPGTVADAISALAKSGVNITSILGWNPAGVVQLVTDNPDAARNAFASAGVAFSEAEARAAELPNEPGALHKHLLELAKQGVNLRSIFGTSSPDNRRATIVWTAEE